MLGDPAPPRSSSPASGDLPQNVLCIVFQKMVQSVDLLIISLLHIWIQPGCGTDVVEDGRAAGCSPSASSHRPKHC